MPCLHENSIATRRKQTNGVIIAFLQCQVCGGGRSIKKDGVNMDTLPEYDPAISERYRMELMQKWEREARESQGDWELKKLQQREEWFEEYNIYLQSDHWRRVRRLVLNRDPLCQRCLVNPSQQAHHISYKTYTALGFSFAHECVGVCCECHDLIAPEGNRA